MLLDKREGTPEMEKPQKSSPEWYKTSITVDFDEIDTPVERLYLVLREKIIKKASLDTNGKMQNLILSVDMRFYGLCKVNMVVTYVAIK